MKHVGLPPSPGKARMGIMLCILLCGCRSEQMWDCENGENGENGVRSTLFIFRLRRVEGRMRGNGKSVVG